MRMSCNGCRVLRKGCSDNCSIRPCLQWIKNPESQANATVFLAKFYGRAGLMNLINAGPEHLRPAIFRSLLYEACGRIVNPIYGSVGLLWSGSWQMCQAAVEAVLKGAPIAQIPSEAAANTSTPPLRAYDIRHVSKDAAAAAAAITTTTDLHKVAKASRIRFKRSGTTSSNNAGDRSMPVTTAAGAEQADTDTEAQVCDLRWSVEYHHREQSHDSSASHESDHQHDRQQLPAGENESMLSADTPDASQVTSHADVECNRNESRGDASEVELELELTLGHYSSSNASSPRSHDDAPVARRERCDSKPLDGLGSEACRVELALDLTV